MNEGGDALADGDKPLGHVWPDLLDDARQVTAGNRTLVLGPHGGLPYVRSGFGTYREDSRIKLTYSLSDSEPLLRP